MKKDSSRVRLCVLVQDGISRLPFEKLIREIVAGGADSIQLREKALSDRALLDRARLCRDGARDILFIVNDRPDIAVLSDADGVHVGQADLPCADARRIVGPGRLVGVSAENVSQLSAAEADGADYLGVGCVFETSTKAIAHQGLMFVREAARAATRPWIAIGGITHANIRSVIEAGAPGVAVCGAVLKDDDPRGATRRLMEAIAEARGK